MPDLLRILALLPKQRQTLLFSATFSDNIKKLAQDFLQNPVTVETARINTANETVKQSIYMVEHLEKFHALVAVIRSRNVRQVLVFTRTKLSAAKVAQQLAKDGITADAIHGDKTQSERIKALEAFKAGNIVALVATDVAARGLDIDHLPLVINYELPMHAEDYVHRIGRTGRAGALGEAVSLIDGEDGRRLDEVEKLLKRSFERAVLPPSERPRQYTGHGPLKAVTSHARKPATDDWFNKPYQPSVVAAKPVEMPVASAPVVSKPVAALFRKKIQAED